ncbi:hypothetical protein B0T16DRAFT_403884 [Cercophora newfieldiana]|uniref:Uncharacterized protein n=1 Tax=Cercophora newfieldiana TaxID=92897 RepID=A0AA39YEZ6_9PEZI|nr:hypothetical protein B0T16DRAFT_403884 [Cercophora newfieldiana]
MCSIHINRKPLLLPILTIASGDSCPRAQLSFEVGGRRCASGRVLQGYDEVMCSIRGDRIGFFLFQFCFPPS